jgi:hypothetical protein
MGLMFETEAGSVWFGVAFDEVDENVMFIMLDVENGYVGGLAQRVHTTSRPERK